MPPMRILAATILAIGLGACNAQPPTGSSGRASDPLILTMHFEPPTTCRVEIGGRQFQLPAEEAALLEALTTLRRRWDRARIEGGVDIPYRCLGSAIYLAQRGGFEQVGFTAEPPE